MELLLIYYNTRLDKITRKRVKGYYSKDYKVGSTNSYGHILINIFVITQKGMFITDNFNTFKKDYLSGMLDKRSTKDKLIDKLVDYLIRLK